MIQKVTPMMLGLVLVSAPLGATDFKRPGPPDQPTPVAVTIAVLDLDDIDTQNQAFTANVLLRAIWTDPRLAHDGTGVVSRALAEMWHPNLQILNQQRLWTTFPDRAEIAPDGSVLWRQRYWGAFSQPLDLRTFPFDRQTLKLQVVSASQEHGMIALEAAHDVDSGMAEALSVADWTVLSSTAAAETIDLGAGAPPIQALSLIFTAERGHRYYVIKIIVPLVLIVAMSWVVFWIDPSEAGTQISVAITTMLTLIAYRFSVDAILPRVSYLTSLDYFILLSTVLVYASLVEVVVTSNLARKGGSHDQRARRIDWWCRWVFPAMFALTALETLVLRAIL